MCSGAVTAVLQVIKKVLSFIHTTMSTESNDIEKNISHLDPSGVDNAYIPPEQPETKHSRFNIDRDTLRNHLIAAVGEFCGTFMFL